MNATLTEENDCSSIHIETPYGALDLHPDELRAMLAALYRHRGGPMTLRVTDFVARGFGPIRKGADL
jgi:hypothetical protein